jgi:hypothetical protein
MTFTPEAFRSIMEKYWRMAVHDGMISAASTPEDFYGFKPDDVECMHYRLAGFGYGTWFRLRDGRVFDRSARPSTPTRSIYDVTVH